MIIYKTTNLVNGKFYIGKDKNDNSSYLGSGKILKLAIKKFGKENFVKETLEICNDEKTLDLKEIYWIDKLSGTTYGYNISEGGTGGDNFKNNPNLQEIKNKISKAKKGKNKGVDNHMFGKTHDIITKNKIALKTKERLSKSENHPLFGKKHSEETKIKMSNNHYDCGGEKNPMFGKTFEDIWREKGFTDEEIIIKKEAWLKNHNTFFRDNHPSKNKNMGGENNPFFGKKHSELSKKKISESRKKPVLQYSLAGELIKEWDSPKEVYDTLKIQCNNCCNGITKTACGFIWKYKERVTDEN